MEHEMQEYRKYDAWTSTNTFIEAAQIRVLYMLYILVSSDTRKFGEDVNLFQSLKLFLERDGLSELLAE